MIRLVGTNKLQVVLSGAATASRVTVSYMDFTATATTGDTQLSVTNGVTPVDICAAPAASTTRQVDHISLVALAAMTATFSINDGTARDLFKVTLALGDTFDWAHSGGARVLDANGNLKTVVSGAIAATTLAVSGDSILTGDLAVNGGDLTTTATTFNLLAANATTVNAFGAASVALNIGHASAAAAFPGGISIPTGKTLSGAGAINISGSITGAAISGTTLSASGLAQFNAMATVTGAAGANTFRVLTSGAGDGLVMTGLAAGSGGSLASVNNAAGAFAPLALKGSTVSLNIGATAKLSIDAAGAVTIPGTLGVTGVISTNGASVVAASAGDIVVKNAQGLRGETAAGTGTLRMAIVDANNVMQLGLSQNLPVAIPYTAAASLDAGGAYLNGRIEVDSTNNRLIYYSGAARYYIAGTTF